MHVSLVKRTRPSCYGMQGMAVSQQFAMPTKVGAEICIVSSCQTQNWEKEIVMHSLGKGESKMKKPQEKHLSGSFPIILFAVACQGCCFGSVAQR